MKFKKLQKFLLAASMIVCVQSGALAGPMTFESAVAEYKAGKYQSALPMFKSFAARSPNNALVQYYIGLCQHRLGHVEQAKQAYQIAVSARDARISPMAQSALSQISGVRTSGSSGSTGGSSNQIQSGGASTASPSQASSRGKAKKVIEFYADW